MSPQIKPRVRFAPSPTGRLHLGGARTALSNFLYAKRHGGKFLLRIEDTDTARSKKKYIDQICHSLQWLGLNWDEDLVFQSNNNFSYKRHLNQLLQSKKAYRCFSSKKELEDIRQGKDAFNYTGLWRNRDPEDIKKELQKETPYTIRLRTPNKGKIVFNDIVYGTISVSCDEIDDFILARSDGTPVYNFTNVVDDSEMKITHVIRGEDHLSNTSKQILIYEALSLKVPIFAHLPMILGDDKSRLSKRHGATGVHEYQSKGYQPEALLNYLALLGWNPGTEEEIFNLNRLIEIFDLSRVQKKSAVYDNQKFKWMSSQHLAMQNEKSILDGIIKLDEKWGTPKNIKFKLKVIGMMKQRSHSLLEIMEQSYYFFKGPKRLNNLEHGTFWEIDAITLIKELNSSIMLIEDWSYEKIEIHIKNFITAKNLGFGRVMKPLRYAISGKTKGPSLFGIIELIGRDEFHQRVDDATSKFLN